MKPFLFSCLAAIPLLTVTGCTGDREQPASTTTTTTEESTTVHQPEPSTTTETTVQKN